MYYWGLGWLGQITLFPVWFGLGWFGNLMGWVLKKIDPWPSLSCTCCRFRRFVACKRWGIVVYVNQSHNQDSGIGGVGRRHIDIFRRSCENSLDEQKKRRRLRWIVGGKYTYLQYSAVLHRFLARTWGPHVLLFPSPPPLIPWLRQRCQLHVLSCTTCFIVHAWQLRLFLTWVIRLDVCVCLYACLPACVRVCVSGWKIYCIWHFSLEKCFFRRRSRLPESSYFNYFLPAVIQDLIFIDCMCARGIIRGYNGRNTIFLEYLIQSNRRRRRLRQSRVESMYTLYTRTMYNVRGLCTSVWNNFEERKFTVHAILSIWRP